MTLLSDKDFEDLINIFEKIMKNKVNGDYLEISGDEIESFCEEITNRLNLFYGNI